MNVPKGNAVALQALKPIENKTADILSGYVFELIKQGMTEQRENNDLLGLGQAYQTSKANQAQSMGMIAQG